MTRSVDVVVVGAGPAGASAARQLAVSGRRVVLLDRSTFPRAKVCGDGLTPRAVAMLERLGVWSSVRAHATIVTRLETLDLVTGDTRSGPLPSRVDGGPGFGAVVSRTILDDAVRRAAVSAGVAFVAEATVHRVEPGTGATPGRVWATTGGERRVYEADVVVAADGASSRIARDALGSKPGIVRGVAVRQYWIVPAPEAFVICIPLRDRCGDVSGYGWVFPAGPGVANVGVGVVGDRREVVREIYRGFIARLRRDSASWRRAAPVGPVEGGALAAGMQRGRVATDGLLFVGDAAGSVNAFSGEGIAQALTSGLMAAEAIAATPNAARQLGDAYWERLEASYPESTRNVAWLPWLVDRGSAFTREFWLAASSPSGAMSRAARRISIDESPAAGAARSRAAGEDEAVWATLTRRFANRRPLLGQVLDALASDAAPLAAQGAAILRGRADPSDPPPPDADVALAIIAAVLLLTSEPDARPTRDDPLAIDAVAEWAADAMTLGVADLLVAELFQVLARMPSRWGMALSSAASIVLARATARAASACDDGAVRDDVVDIVHGAVVALAAEVNVGAAAT